MLQKKTNLESRKVISILFHFRVFSAMASSFNHVNPSLTISGYYILKCELFLNFPVFQRALYQHSLQAGLTHFPGSPLPAQTPSLTYRGQTDSCCFLSLGTTLMLQSQSPSREDGVSLSWSRGSRWDSTALYGPQRGKQASPASLMYGQGGGRHLRII